MRKSKFKVIKLKRKKKRTKKRFVTILVIAVTLFVFNLLFFRIKVIEVKGSKNVSDDKIIKCSGVNKGNVMFFVLYGDLSKALSFRSGEIEDRIRENCPEIDSVSANIKFPNKLVINVKERVPIGYVANANTVLLVDKESIVIDILDKTDALGFPVMKGVSFTNSKVGEKIKIKDDERFLAFRNIVMSIESADENNNMVSLMKRLKTVDVGDINKIFMNLGDGLTVNLGDRNELGYKVNLLQGMLGQIKHGEKGTVDFALGKDPVFIPK